MTETNKFDTGVDYLYALRDYLMRGKSLRSHSCENCRHLFPPCDSFTKIIVTKNNYRSDMLHICSN